MLALDVTDEASMVAAVREVEDTHGPLGGLVNNAGYGEYGPVEEVPIDAVRRQFETNVFGLLRLTQLVLPGMRAGRPRPDRQHLLDGRPDDAAGRRCLPRQQVRRGGAQRRAAVRDPRVRHRSLGGGSRSGAHRVRGTPRPQHRRRDGPYAAFRRGVAERNAAAYHDPKARGILEPEAVRESS